MHKGYKKLGTVQSNCCSDGAALIFSGVFSENPDFTALDNRLIQLIHDHEDIQIKGRSFKNTNGELIIPIEIEDKTDEYTYPEIVTLKVLCHIAFDGDRIEFRSLVDPNQPLIKTKMKLEFDDSSNRLIFYPSYIDINEDTRRNSMCPIC